MATDNLSTYEYLVRKFGEETIKSRHKWISDTLIVWIEQHDYSQRVEVMSEQIDQILIDYFVDIDRLKDFSEIERTNTAKIYAYMAYWILRRKPLQVVTKDAAEDLVFVNENFVADFLFGYVYENLEEQVKDIKDAGFDCVIANADPRMDDEKQKRKQMR